MTTSVARTRHAGFDDVEQVTAMHRRCSPESLHRRFHVPLANVPPRLVRRLLIPSDGWSVVAEHRGGVIGLACAGPLSDTDLEVGLLVEDAHQGHGVGTLLLRRLAEDACDRGYTTLVCLTQPDDEAVLRTVRAAGLDAATTWHDGVLEVRAPLAPPLLALGQPA